MFTVKLNVYYNVWFLVFSDRLSSRVHMYVYYNVVCKHHSYKKKIFSDGSCLKDNNYERCKCKYL